MKSKFSSDNKSAVLLLFLSTIGFGISGYLTFVHYAPSVLVCSSQGLINCQKVLTSTYSVIPGTSLPITILGLLFFLVSFILTIWELSLPLNFKLRQLHAALAGLSVIVALYLVFIELVELHNICIWCTTIHIITLATFLTTIWRSYPDPKTLENL